MDGDDGAENLGVDQFDLLVEAEVADVLEKVDAGACVADPHAHDFLENRQDFEVFQVRVLFEEFLEEPGATLQESRVVPDGLDVGETELVNVGVLELMLAKVATAEGDEHRVDEVVEQGL